MTMTNDDRLDARREIVALANRCIRERGAGERRLFMRHLQGAVNVLRSNGWATSDLLARAGFNPRTTPRP